MAAREISIELQYEKHDDGRYFVKSLDVPGFRLVGTDLDAILRDVDPVVKDLLHHNLGLEVETLRWVPSLEDTKRHLTAPAGKATYVASLKAAA